MTNGKLKITVDKAYDLQELFTTYFKFARIFKSSKNLNLNNKKGENIPENLFCLFEFDGKGLATDSNQVRSGTSVRWNEEAEFEIKKTANLRIQVCTKEGKGKLDVRIFCFLSA